MRFKLTKELCYLAGATSSVATPERSLIGIRTTNDGIVQRFIEYSITLGVKPEKIIITEKDESKGVYYYHSKLAAQMREIVRGKAALPKRSRGMALYFVAGMFDLKGSLTHTGIAVSGLDKADCLLLELLGVHTRSSRIVNGVDFIYLIRNESVLAAAIKLPEGKRERAAGRRRN